MHLFIYIHAYKCIYNVCVCIYACVYIYVYVFLESVCVRVCVYIHTHMLSIYKHIWRQDKCPLYMMELKCCSG